MKHSMVEDHVVGYRLEVVLELWRYWLARGLHLSLIPVMILVYDVIDALGRALLESAHLFVEVKMVCKGGISNFVRFSGNRFGGV